MTSETAISRWLRTEMPRRGYPLQGHRAGGISRLAEDAGIPQATMSRIVNGRAEPSIESLRKLAHLWEIPLGEILVHAGIAGIDDLRTAPCTSDTSTPPASIPSDIILDSLEPWERHIWLTPDLTVEQRRSAIRWIRVQRGDHDDVVMLLALSDALHEAIGRQLRRRDHNPRRVV